MQNVDMHYDGEQPKKPSEKAKMSFIALIKVNDNMTDDQKKFFNNYNIMQKELIKNNLMDPK